MAKNKVSKKLLYEGKAKILYEGPETGTLIQYFKDDTSAFNGEKLEVLSGKGVINNRISEYLFQKLEDIGIHTHFIKRLNMREQLIKACEMIPIEIIVRNVTAGSLSKRFALDVGMNLFHPMVEMCLKSDKLGDPFITDEHINVFGWALPEEVEAMKGISLRINDFLCGIFHAVGVKLVDIKLEFGRVFDEEGNVYLLLADEISPDSCRLWDIETGNILDKDRFRKNMGGVLEAYREVAKRLGVLKGIEDENVVSFETKPTTKDKTKK
ncbi:MAG: phosphoribosylaminoimidazolesuccinocarboxamide synthase [Rickettsiales bacterium]|nr:phosphoribosylaminoimidazolesuccinocarboxamide synthase [Rickettsiales bacterium]